MAGSVAETALCRGFIIRSRGSGGLAHERLPNSASPPDGPGFRSVLHLLETNPLGLSGSSDVACFGVACFGVEQSSLGDKTRARHEVHF